RDFHVTGVQTCALPLFAPLAVRDLWGVGEQTAAKLQRYGVRIVSDLRTTPEATLTRIVGPAAAHHLVRLAVGDDRRPVIAYEAATGRASCREGRERAAH